MDTTIFKRSVVISGHRTSISLENAFWTALHEIAVSQRRTRSDLLADIAARREGPNLSSAIRVFVLEFYRERVRHEGGERVLTTSPPLASGMT